MNIEYILLYSTNILYEILISGIISFAILK